MAAHMESPMQTAGKPRPEIISGSASGPDNRWFVGPQDVAALRSGAALGRVAELGVLELEGPDAISFLQAQCTADIVAMSGASWQLGGYCSAKGRLLAIFHAWRWDGGLRLLLPANIAAALARRLSMFVLRARVRVRDVSEAWTVLAINGPQTATQLRIAGLAVPEPWQCQNLQGDGRIARLPDALPHGNSVLLVVPERDRAQWLEHLAAFPPAGSGLWWWSQIRAAIPTVFASTQELFVPQSVNLEVLGGVNFRKGCYPGQEIVARSQYLGKLRRRLALANAQQIGAGSDVFAAGSDAPVGRIVMAAQIPGGGWELLIECPTELATQGGLHAGSPDAPVLDLQPLPYAIFDPTA